MDSENITQKQFIKIDGPAERSITGEDVLLALKFEKVQPVSGNGFAFTISLSNNSSGDKEILNPLDYFHVTMEDEEGWPVQLPIATPDRALLNIKQPIEIQRPYIVEFIKNNRDDSNLLETVNDERIILKAETTYEYKIRIDKVQDYDKKTLARTAQNKPLAKGKYKINLKMSIMLASEKGTVYYTYESGYMEFELV